MKEFDWFEVLALAPNEGAMLKYLKSVNNTSFGVANWSFISADEMTWEEAVEQEGLIVLEMLADSWVTCAVGQLCRDIPKDGGAPVDSIAEALGEQFAGDIENKAWSDAIKTLVRIEENTARILSKQEKANK